MARLSSRLLVRCSCLRGGHGERDGPPAGHHHHHQHHQHHQGSHEDPEPPCLLGEAVGVETIHVTVEDVDNMGLDNPSFSLSQEEEVAPTQSSGINGGGVGGGSAIARSVSACQRAMKKRRLKALSSLPLLTHLVAVRVSRNTEEDHHRDEEEEGQDEEEEGETTWTYLRGDAAGGGGLLRPPLIHLIPPTPSDVVEDDDEEQFFDVNSEGDESHAAHTSDSDGSFAPGDRESCDEEKVDSTDETETEMEMETGEEEEEKEAKTPMGHPLAENQVDGEDKMEAVQASQDVEPLEDTEPPSEESVKDDLEPTTFLRSAYQVAPLPEYPRKKSFNMGINLLAFTEHNLDDLSNKDISCPQLLKARLSLLPYTTRMDASTQMRKPASRSCSLGDRTGGRSRSFHVTGQTVDQDQGEEGSSRQRRITIASYMPSRSSQDQNGNFAEKEDNSGQVAKRLGALNTEEVCQWFSSIGLQRCHPFIREGHLCGEDIASVDAKTLDTLHVSTLEDRELLLSAIYKELHPPSSLTQRLDSLIETFGPQDNVESFAAALASMSKSKSSPHVSCLNTTHSSLKLRTKSHMMHRSSQLVEITVHALDQIVHLRTPKDTTVGKVKESCIKMLGRTVDKDTFTLKDNQGLRAGLPANQQIGNLLTASNRQLELHLCKKDKQTEGDISKVNSSQEDDGSNVNNNVPANEPAKEEKIREVDQQVDSLQHVIHQVQELHHGLVAFCSELKNMDLETDMKALGPGELGQRLESAQGQLRERSRSLQNLKENISNASVQRRAEVRLIDKMKLNCQLFKEEISLVHLNRQVAHLKNALQDCSEKERSPSTTEHQSPAVGPLSQLVSPQSPAMLLVVQERAAAADGRYGFTCGPWAGGQGLVVVRSSDPSQLCLEDRLVEVNGVTVVNSTEEDLRCLLQQGGSSAQIVVLRRPSSLSPAPRRHPGGLHPSTNKASPRAGSPERDAVAAETPPQRELIAI